jgi:exodeoxyribonuclease-5
LPPVKGEGYFINATPEVMLTEIHRQAAENPIIRMSIDVREGRGLKVGEYGSSLVTQQSKLSRNQLTDQVMSADQMLCGTNATRVALNARMRRVKGFSGTPKAEFPVVGDRLVCLRNKRDMGLLNGSLWDVKQVEYAPGGRSSVSTLKMVVDSADGAGLSGVEVEVPEHFFLGTDKDLDWRQKAAYQEFTYGYALTVHKAQGSQWDNVLLFDESRVFRDDAQKHLYTAVTRAAEKVVVLQ